MILPERDANIKKKNQDVMRLEHVLGNGESGLVKGMLDGLL